jgi:polyvinyl alcohol dehydrogenase (cytochrome)
MKSAVAGVLLLVSSASAFAQTPDGAAVYERACASCHANPAADSRAPRRETLALVAPEAILTALTSGNMFRQGSELSEADRRAVAAFLAGRPIGTPAPPNTVGRCTTAPRALTAANVTAGWNGFGGTVANTRYQTADRAGLTAANVPRLTLKWAFGFAGVNSARAQPTVAGGRVFVGSENGDVYALDAKTGCTHWAYHAQAGIRTAMAIGPYKTANASGLAVYFTDGGATAYAIDAQSGRELWRRKVDNHPYAAGTGSPTYYNGRLYVVTAGVGEEGQGGRIKYECCTFRGSVSALDANTHAE